MEESPIIRSHEAHMKVTVGIGDPEEIISVPVRVGRVLNTSGGIEESIAVVMVVVGGLTGKSYVVVASVSLPGRVVSRGSLGRR